MQMQLCISTKILFAKTSYKKSTLQKSIKESILCRLKKQDWFSLVSGHGLVFGFGLNKIIYGKQVPYFLELGLGFHQRACNKLCTIFFKLISSIFETREPESDRLWF
jgi:hypothetical protein